MYTSLVLYFSIFALSMERTRLSFHCWLYNLCIVVYVTNKTWNLKMRLSLLPLVLIYFGNCSDMYLLVRISRLAKKCPQVQLCHETR